MKFIIWAVVLFIVMFLGQMIVPIPLGAMMQGRMAKRSQPEGMEPQPVLTGAPREGTIALIYGLVVGAALAFGISALTWRLVSTHWFPSLIVAVGFFVTGGAGQRLSLSGALFGPSTDRLIAAMFGGYTWGGILGLVVFRVMKAVG